MVISITILSRTEGSREVIDLNFFITFSSGTMGMIYPLENILLFIPLGILLPLLWHQLRHLDYILEVGLLLSVLIELIQFTTKRGFLQTDDILMNELGTLLGFILYRISSVIWHREIQK